MKYQKLDLKDRNDIIYQYFNQLNIGTYITHKEDNYYDVTIDYLDKIDGKTYSWIATSYDIEKFYTNISENESNQLEKNTWISKFNKLLSK